MNYVLQLLGGLENSEITKEQTQRLANKKYYRNGGRNEENGFVILTKKKLEGYFLF
jgi:hypothetical protein